MKVAVRHAAGSDVGLVRQTNEDSAYAGSRLLAVADGMGGHEGGEVASAVVISTLREFDADVPPDKLEDTLRRAVRTAHERLRRLAGERAGLERMGTTLTAMLWSGTAVALAHIGDSRAYRLRDGRLRQLTEDHTLEGMLAEGGEEARHSTYLLNVLDGRSDREADYGVGELRAGDRYLLCSDGLSGVVGSDALREVLEREGEASRVVRRLVELARQAGGPDNITVAVADVVEGTPGDVSAAVLGAAAEQDFT